MASLLKQVKSKLFIVAHRRTLGLLDGEYGSVFKGRSLDFDELRTYVPGDDVRDIDWKATARHGAPLTKRYNALRRQTVLLVADTGRNMAATSESGNAKHDIAIEALGLMGYLALRHGDDVGLLHGNSLDCRFLPARAGEDHLERLLREVLSATGPESPRSGLQHQLEFLLRHFRRRMLIFVAGDQFLPDDHTESLLRRLQVRHEILWFTVRDADLTAPSKAAMANDQAATAHDPARTIDISDGTAIPGAPAGDAAVRAAYATAMEGRERTRQHTYRRLGIAEATAGGTAEVVSTLFALLEQHRLKGRAHAR